MNATIQVLNGRGHLTLEWNPEDPQEAAGIRAEVENLKAAGYSFWLTEDAPADEVAAGRGKLLVKRIEDPVKELTAPDDDGDLPYEAPAVTSKRRGRPPREAVAVRPQRGG